MESIYTELALYGSKNECARTDNVYFPISEVCDGMVSLYQALPNPLKLLLDCMDCMNNKVVLHIFI